MTDQHEFSNVPISINMGYDGNAHMDAGYFFAPFVPLTTTPPIFDREFSAEYTHARLREGERFWGVVRIGPEGFEEVNLETRVNWLKEGF